MSENKYPNSGILFRNDKKQAGDKLPDYRGTAEVDGVAWEVSGWIKPSNKNPAKKFMSLSFKPPYKKDADPGAYEERPKQEADDQEIPF